MRFRTVVSGLITLGFLVGEANAQSRAAPYVISDSNLLPQGGGDDGPNCEQSLGGSWGPPAPFDLAVCEFHDPRRTPLEMEDTIAALQGLQTQGLRPSEQALASFMEGVLSCRMARATLAQTSQGLSPERATIDYCALRRRAIASLNGFNWRTARFDYDPTSARSIYDLIDEMAACYDHLGQDGVLNVEANARCGIGQGVSEAQLQEITSQATQEVFAKFFGSNNPTTAIFERKRQMAVNVVARSGARLQNIETQAAQVNSVHTKINTHINGAFATAADAAYNNYREALATIVAVRDAFHRWKDTLLFDVWSSPPESLGLRLTGSWEEPTEPCKVQEPTCKTEGCPIISKLDDERRSLDCHWGMTAAAQEIADTVTRIANRRQISSTGIRRLCAAYYCQVATNFTFAAPPWTPFRMACLDPYLGGGEGSPLCDPAVATLQPDPDSDPQFTPISPASLCQDVGFDATNYGDVDRVADPSQVRSCFNVAMHGATPAAPGPDPHAPVDPGVATPAPTPQNLILEGTVAVAEQAPLEEIRVSIFDDRDPTFVLTKGVDGEGYYIFKSLRPSGYTLIVEGAEGPHYTAQIELNQNAVHDVALEESVDTIQSPEADRAGGGCQGVAFPPWAALMVALRLMVLTYGGADKVARGRGRGK